MKKEKIEIRHIGQMESKVIYPGNQNHVGGISLFFVEKNIDYKAYRESMPYTVDTVVNNMSAGCVTISEEFIRWIDIPTPDAKYSLIKERIINKWRD